MKAGPQKGKHFQFRQKSGEAFFCRTGTGTGK
jgi:hypothetical protein